MNSFSAAQVIGLYTSTYEKQFDNVDTSKVSPFTSEIIPYMYSDCSKLREGAGEDGTFYSVYDVYNHESETLKYLHGTNLLCYYFYREGYRPLEPVDMSEDEAVEVANTFLNTFLITEQLAKFEAPIITEGPEDIFLYTIKYVRRIAGYDTDETLTVFISLSGKVVAYNGMGLDKYDDYVDVITENNVNEAKELIESRLETLGLPDYRLRDIVIITSTEGKPFLRIGVEFVDECGLPRLESCMVDIATSES